MILVKEEKEVKAVEVKTENFVKDERIGDQFENENNRNKDGAYKKDISNEQITNTFKSKTNNNSCCHIL